MIGCSIGCISLFSVLWQNKVRDGRFPGALSVFKSENSQRKPACQYNGAFWDRHVRSRIVHVSKDDPQHQQKRRVPRGQSKERRTAFDGEGYLIHELICEERERSPWD
jgi:hypothetical protein